MHNPANNTDGDDDPRDVAVSVLVDLLAHGRSLSASLDAHSGRLNERRDRAFARELCYGVMRWLPRLQACLGQLLEKPLREKQSAVRAVLLLGLYQLMFTRVAEHAAVAESVTLVRRRGKPWATGLVNGVLRNFQRGRQRLTAELDNDGQARYAHRSWLIDATREAWPVDWEKILDSNNQRPPLSLRVNARRCSREEYMTTLGASNIAASPIAHTDHGLRLHEARDVERIPGFTDGLVSVQDGAAQLSADLLDAQAGMRVLDACAAPGGKCAHILEREADLDELVAIDYDTERLLRVEDNLRRLCLPATLLCADAGAPEQWWDGRLFHRILIDAPCSATGVIRRHPDIKFHRRPGDLAALAATQGRLLAALWPLLAPRGRLLYATCSYLPRENDHVLAEFLAGHPDACSESMPYSWGHATGLGRQVLPGEDTMDGFYYAMLGKR